MKKNSVVDYRKVRLSNLTTSRFNHLFLILFWPVFGITFAWVEKCYPIDNYINVSSPLDGLVPFCEWFVIPYVFWFAYLIGMHVYTLLFNVPLFRKMMWFFIITYTVTLLIYLVFPTCQNLRPTSFEHDNLLTRFMTCYYEMDTHTNVCPSLHVIGSLAVMFTSWHVDEWRVGTKAVTSVIAVLICVSTVFVKQHSVIDVFVALPICVAAYFIVFKFASVSTCAEKEKGCL